MNIHLKNKRQECEIGPVRVDTSGRGESKWRGSRGVNITDVIYIYLHEIEQ
jgi:hypothetical protein